MRVTLAVGLAILVGSATPLTASAHIALVSPSPRSSSQKVGPCGAGASVRGTPTVVAAGSVLRVRWNETIDHPGHFRISFDDSGDDAFVDPASAMDTYTNAAVLLDDIADKKGGEYEVEVKLPDVACDKCTLQLIQLMTDKAPYQPGTNDLYYQCADLTLVRAQGPMDGGTVSVDAGGSSESDAGSEKPPQSDGGQPLDEDAGGAGSGTNTGNGTGGTDEAVTTGASAPPAASGGCDVHATARDAFHLWIFAALALMLRRLRAP
jgi:hypothetical protein